MLNKKPYVIKESKFLHQLANKQDQSKLLKKSSPSQIRAILELSVNNVVRSKKPNQEIVTLVRKCCSPTLHRKGSVHVKALGIVKAKKILNQTGGFLPLIPLLLSVLPFIGKAVLAGVVTAGAVHLVKKALE